MRSHIMLTPKQVLLLCSVLRIDVEMLHIDGNQRNRLWIGFSKEANEVYVSSEHSKRHKIFTPEAFLNAHKGIFSLDFADVISIVPEYYVMQKQ